MKPMSKKLKKNKYDFLANFNKKGAQGIKIEA